MTAVVPLPGLDGTGEMFEDFVKELKGNSIVVAYPRDRPLDYAEVERLVEEALPRDEPFVVLGESFSGPIAISLAAKHMPRLQAIILVCTFARLPYPRLPVFLQRVISEGPFWRMPAAITARTILGSFCTPRLMEKLRHTRASVAPQVWKARLRAVLGVDYTPLLARIEIPVLYLRAQRDRLIFASAAKWIQQHLPAAELVTLDGPHWLLQTKPAEAAAVIHGFLRRHGIALD